MYISTPTSVLRFITAGNVDDGKSTLIGRLLYDSQALLSDQIDHLNQRSQNSDTLDLASLTDGLSAEREQGITIDVAYRYFRTKKRKFIIADTPGHEQYTRNMVTGASLAHAAIILIDATRINFNEHPIKLLPQTKRHSTILKHLGCQHIIVAINKLDLLNYQQDKFITIVQAYQALAKKLALTSLHFIPISALHGDNIVHKSEAMPWYDGKPLLSVLEHLPDAENTLNDDQQTYFPIQRVARQDGSATNDFRGYQGRLENGSLSVGQTVRIEPSRLTTTIKAIYLPDTQVDRITAGVVATVEFNDDIDVSRGDVIVDSNAAIHSTHNISATLCWLDEQPLSLTRRYWLKHGTQMVYAKVKQVEHIWDAHTLDQTKTTTLLKMNDIGHVRLVTQKPIAATTYDQNTASGAFIIIDETTNHTVAAGMITETGEGMLWEI